MGLLVSVQAVLLGNVKIHYQPLLLASREWSHQVIENETKGRPQRFSTHSTRLPSVRRHPCLPPSSCGAASAFILRKRAAAEGIRDWKIPTDDATSGVTQLNDGYWEGGLRSVPIMFEHEPAGWYQNQRKGE